jgi:hypothetical protein
MERERRRPRDSLAMSVMLALGMRMLDGDLFFAHGLFAHRNHAGMGGFADNAFELNCRVVDAEASVKLFIDFAQNRIALGGRHVGDFDVSRERVIFRTDAPHVEVVDITDSGDGANCGFDLIEADAAGSTLEQDVESFANDAET